MKTSLTKLKQIISDIKYLSRNFSFGVAEKRKLSEPGGSLKYKRSRNLEKITKINEQIDFYTDKLYRRIMSKVQSPGHFVSLSQNKIDDLNRHLQLTGSLGDIIGDNTLTEFFNYLQNIYNTNGYFGFMEDSAYNKYSQYIHLFNPSNGLNPMRTRGNIIRLILADRFTHDLI